MSKHVSRKSRWNRLDSRRYDSALGRVVYMENGWYALLTYQLRESPETPDALPSWRSHEQRLGPFKRPRNGMVELEREVTFLQNRHGDAIRFGEGLSGDA